MRIQCIGFFAVAPKHHLLLGEDLRVRATVFEQNQFDGARSLIQRPAEIALPVTVCHFPPGNSKWNKIEHRLFSFITQNWRGKPLVSHEVIVNLIAATTTDTGLRVHAQLDASEYPLGKKVTDAELAAVNIQRHAFHGDWNYTILPSGNGTVVS